MSDKGNEREALAWKKEERRKKNGRTTRFGCWEVFTQQHVSHHGAGFLTTQIYQSVQSFNVRDDDHSVWMYLRINLRPILNP